ncbi:MAG: zinc-ribbon and DUF3426 domain-containing protein [Burkholderiales bacterium]
MSLATRCSACGTVFRVVQDQLKVSEGWVRCGRCNDVFNALESLFDLERDKPPEWSPSEPAPEDTPPDQAEIVAAERVSDASLVDRIDAQLLGSRRRESDFTPAARVDERDRLDFPDAQFEPDSVSGEAIVAVHDTTLESEALRPDVTAPSATPEFIRHAQRRARWDRPVARGALAVAGLLLLSTLALQIGHHFRDTIAMRWPTLAPVLMTWCATQSCSIQPPKRIEDIAVESSALTRATGLDAFNLAVTLRNRGGMTLALPSIDLSLTDPSGQVVARRMLAPSEWRLATPTIQAGTELPLQLLLTAANARVSGYTVEIFYP